RPFARTCARRRSRDRARSNRRRAPRGAAPPTRARATRTTTPTRRTAARSRRSRSERCLSVRRSEALDDARDRLAEADAHARDAVALVPPLELVQQRRSHARAGRAEGMAERDAAAVRVDVGAAFLEPRVVCELQHDRRERLVDLDDRDVVPG